MAGPLWIDSLFDSDFVNSMLNELKNCENGTSLGKDHARLLKMMKICTLRTCNTSYFETDSIASSAKKSSISLDKVISTLGSNGFQSSKTIMNKKGFKTNASPKEIIELLYK